jgi:nitrate reductase NapA
VAPGAGIHFYGQPDGRAVVHLQKYVRSPDSPDAEFPLLLTTGRVLEEWHTGTMTGKIPNLREASGPARIEISRFDADRLDVSHGDEIELTSRYGTVRGLAALVENLRPGLLFAAFYDAQLLINRVVSDHVDPSSKEPEYKVTAVAARKIRDGKLGA